jgi:putative protease
MAAVGSGADSVYLGLSEFNARRQATNFSLAEIKYAINFAHEQGTKVYLTLNILTKNKELAQIAFIVKKLARYGIDAFIVQDWAVYELCRRYAPEVPLHASTQMNVHNSLAIDFLAHKGFKRATLSRELSLEEIKTIIERSPLEIEVFAHGALCFAYSGQCLMSSMIGGRSGNRGLCPQACRLPYRLLKKSGKVVKREGNYLLSTKDLCSIKLIPDFIKTGVSALKIEGRLKSAFYVATVTRVYREALDRYRADPQNFQVKEAEILTLAEAFNRGFTEGYFKKIKDKRLISFTKPNDRGVFIGRVAYLNKIRGELAVSLRQELCRGDEIEVWVTRGGRLKFTVRQLILDEKQVECAPAGTRPVIKIEGLRHQIQLGDRVFRVKNKKLVFKAQDSIRQAKKLFEKIKRDTLASDLSSAEVGELVLDLKKPKRRKSRRAQLIVCLSELAQAKLALREGADWIYLNLITPRRGGRQDFKERIIACANLCHQYGGKFAIVLPNIAHDTQVSIFKKLIRATEKHLDALVVGNLAFLASEFRTKIPLIADWQLNIFNSITANFFQSLGLKRITLSPELSFNQMKELSEQTELELEIFAHGWLEVMVAEHCLVDEECEKCSTNSYLLEDQKRYLFPIEVDLFCRSHIYNSKELCLLRYLKQIQKAGINFYRLALERYSSREIQKIVRAYKRALTLLGQDETKWDKLVQSASEVHTSFSQNTTGHFFREVL